MEIGIILTVGILFFLTFCWIFGIDMKSILTTFVILGIIVIILIFILVPEVNLKYRIVNETNKNQTLQDITQTLSEEEIKYYKTAMLFKSDECMDHTVKYIIKVGEDLSKTNIRNYLN